MFLSGFQYSNINASGQKISTNHSIFQVLKWKLTEPKPQAWPKFVEVKQIPKNEIIERSKTLKISYITHSTFLIQINNVNIITDPILFSGIGLFERFFKIDMIHKPGIAPENLPPIDYVLISHNHYDHMDIKSIKFLAEKFNPTFVMGKGNYVYNKKITNKFVELNWNEKFDAGSVEIHFLRAKHWSKRGLFDTNKALWGAFAIVSRYDDKKIYFAGDTAHFDHFSEAGKKFNGFDVALLPIGAYKPNWFMKESHINPFEAVLAHKELQAKVSIPMHYQSVQLSDEQYGQPIHDLKTALKENNLTKEAFQIVNIGEFYEEK